MTRFIALVSGKGGVGKTTTTLNLGLAFNKLGKKVLLLDANLATPNLALLLGMVNPENTLNNFLSKKKELKEITYLHHSGVSLIPSSPSYTEYQKTNPQKMNKIFEHLDNLNDITLVDAPSGLGYEVNQILKNTDETLIIVNPHLSSVMDALKTIHLAKANHNIVLGAILNRSNKGRNEMSVKEIEEILGYPVIGNIRNHNKFRKSTNKQIPLMELYPRSKFAKEFMKIATKITMN